MEFVLKHEETLSLLLICCHPRIKIINDLFYFIYLLFHSF